MLGGLERPFEDKEEEDYRVTPRLLKSPGGTMYSNRAKFSFIASVNDDAEREQHRQPFFKD